MQPVGEHDQEGFGLGIDPDRRAGIAGMAVGVRREGGREPHGIGRIDVPAQAAQGRPRRAGSAARHRRDRGRLQHALAARQHHLRELREVVGGGEHAGMARDAAHAIGDRILDVAPAQFAAFDVGRRDAVPRAKAAAGRWCRACRAAGRCAWRHRLQRLARDAPHDLAQDDEVDVAVDEARAGGRQRLQRDDGVERALVVRPAARRDAGRQGGIVGHELADGDVALAVGGEGRPVGGGRPVEIDLAALDELLDGHRRRHHLGERGGVVDRVERGRLDVGHHRALAVGLAQHDAVTDAQHDHAAYQVAGRDLLVDDGADRLRRLAGRHGGGRGRRGGGRRRRCRRAGDGGLADQADDEQDAAGQRVAGALTSVGLGVGGRQPWPRSARA